MPKRTYTSLVDYMERTGTNSLKLLDRVFKTTGVRIEPSHFSMILRGSRQCSQWNAKALHDTTGVPMDELTRWPRYAESTKSRAVA